MRSENEQIISSFRHHLVQSGLSDKTIKSYLSDIIQYVKWLEDNGERIKLEINRYQFNQYKQQLLKQNKAPATINKAINSLYSYNQFCNKQNSEAMINIHIGKDKVKVAQGSHREVEVFTEEEVERIHFYLSGDGVSHRNRLIVHLLLYTGVRVGELVSIRLSDLDLLTRQVKIIGKGGKYREIPLKDEVVRSIRMYLDTERKESRFAESPFLLLTQRGSMTKDTVNKILSELGEGAKLKAYPHKFRHTMCTMLLRRGVDLVTVAKISGHASVTTTAQYYINVSKREKQQAIDLL